ncbi:MAG: AAA family ATPase, partial [Acidianus infernus]|nr:AAA family ATPase [Acidianus infernus]
MNEDKISFVFVSILIMVLTIVYRNPLLLLLLVVVSLVAFKYGKIDIGSLIRKIPFFNNSINLSSIKIEDGYIQKGNEYIGVLLIYDIPVDYKDLSENSLRNSIASFYKILQVGEQVDIFFRKKYVDS